MSSKNSRISSNIKAISSYTVPQIECSVKLDGNESPYQPDNEFRGKIIDELRNVKLNRYPDPNFNLIRSKLSEIYSFPEDGIILGNGSDEIIQMLITVFTGKSGIVLMPNPTFSMYKLSSLAQKKEVIESELNDDFDINLDDFKNIIFEYDPDLIFLATPNNPTGNSFSKEKIAAILSSTDAIVVVDEAYFDYSKISYLQYTKEFDNLMILRTMSKIGFASLRLGMLFGNPDLVAELHKTRMPYNINSLTQSIMSVVLENKTAIDEKINAVIKERKKLKVGLSKFPGFKVYPSDANFFLVRVDDADFLFNELVKKDILIRNLNGSGVLKNCVRITVGSKLENEKLLSALASIFFD
ncbi:MAG: histidinol-phosphate transaminase [Thermodesulfobacteriota bacterium]